MTANAQALCSSFKIEALKGSHALGTQSANSVRTVTTADVVKAALYLENQSIGAATTAYSATGELAATGNYTAGGATVTNANAPASDGGTGAIWTPSASISWSNLTSSGSFDCVLLYNASSTGKLSISSHTFGAQFITAGTFTLTMPANALGTALLQLT